MHYSNDQQAIEAVKTLLGYIGEDPERDGLRETPIRVIKSYEELYGGYRVDLPSLFKTFEEKAYDELIILKDIEWTSNCEHHLLPFIGSAHIAYIPNGRVIGISKLARVLDAFSRRLQIQERLTKQITDCLDTYLKPLGSACVLEASHTCISCRGIKKQHSKMITSSLSGVFKDAAVRTEFFNLIKR